MTYFEFMSQKTGEEQPYLSRMSGNFLAKHDHRFHPGGYKEGQKCALREHEGRSMASDTLLPAQNPRTFRPFEPDPNKSVVKNFEDLAAYWHDRAGNFRKGAAHEPYIVHPRKVADVLRRWGFSDDRNPVTMCIAYGHDLLEDAKTPKEDIVNTGGKLGKAIYGGIRMLTFEDNPLWMTKKEKDDGKQEYVDNIAKTAPLGVLAVKMADRLCNTMDFVKDKNPYAKTYLKMGESLFGRLNEFPNRDVIEKTLNEVRERVSRLPDPPKSKEETIEPSGDKKTHPRFPQVRKARSY